MNRFGSCIVAFIVACGALATTAAGAQESIRAGLENCASIRNAAERLFCFDSLAAGHGAKMPEKSQATGRSMQADAANPPPAAASRPAQKPVDDSGTFGLEMEQAREGPNSVASRYAGSFTGWTGDTVFQLENGQVWKQAEADRLVMKAERPMMNIRRGWFGVYYLKVEGSNRQIKVKRIK